MGMLINGQWSTQDQIIKQGAYVRQSSVYQQEISQETIQAIRAEPGRFHLIASLSCPWSHRVMIVHRLKGLESVMPLQIAGGKRMEGYPVNGGKDWAVPGSERVIEHLHELYTMSDSLHTGRSTVPVLWDSHTQSIVSNESTKIMRALEQVPASDEALDFTLLPPHQISEIDDLNQNIYENFSNGVYRAGFAEQQAPYDEAIEQVFQAMDDLELRLSQQRYLMGAHITEADWRLFPTLLRFDAVYFVLHRCSRQRLIDYPHLWAYARDLYAWNKIEKTIDFEAIRRSSYENDTSNNPNSIIAVTPEADWLAPHGREAFGPAQIYLCSGDVVNIDPVTLEPILN